MLNKLRVRTQSESGFTLVELLVVMLILGLLAAIAIPAFFNQRDKAQDADAKATAQTAQTAIETYATDNDGSTTPAPTDVESADAIRANAGDLACAAGGRRRRRTRTRSTSLRRTPATCSRSSCADRRQSRIPVHRRRRGRLSERGSGTERPPSVIPA